MILSIIHHRIFELLPQAVSMYSFGVGVDERNIPDDLFVSPTFQAHARSVVHMLESALVMMLKNELGNLALALRSLGARHVEYGVLPQHYGFVETALLRVLEGGLGPDKWTMKLRKSWAAVFKFIAKAMQSGATSEINIINEQSNEENLRQFATLRLTLLKPTIGNPDQQMRPSFNSTSSSTCRWGEASSSPPPADNSATSSPSFGVRRKRSSSISTGSLPPSLPRRRWEDDAPKPNENTNQVESLSTPSSIVNEGYIVVSTNTGKKDTPPSSTVTRRRHSSYDDSYWYWEEHHRFRGYMSSDTTGVMKKDVSPSMNMPRRSIH